jgi:hypothetical protein
MLEYPPDHVGCELSEDLFEASRSIQGSEPHRVVDGPFCERAEHQPASWDTLAHEH